MAHQPAANRIPANAPAISGAPRVSRRRFVSAVAAGAPAFLRNPVGAAGERVIVIGAGIAGIAAAVDLQVAGLDVLVLEARNRIGGRIWTDRRWGFPVDLGASWIHGSAQANPIWHLRNKLGLRTIPTDWEDLLVYDVDGKQISTTQSATDAASYMLDGYGELIDSLADSLDIRLSTVVSAVTYGSFRVRVSTNRGTEQAAYAVITVPLGVLKANRISFTPALTRAKREAISRLGVGSLNKLYLGFRERFWDEREAIGYQSANRGEWSLWMDLEHILDEPILLAFNAATFGTQVEGFSDQETLRAAMDVLRTLGRGGHEQEVPSDRGRGIPFGATSCSADHCPGVETAFVGFQHALHCPVQDVPVVRKHD